MDDTAKSNHFVVEIDGRDRIEATLKDQVHGLKVVGCSELLKLLAELKKKHGGDLRTWPLPEGDQHQILLVRELILRAQGRWSFPYNHEEICHCRMVATRLVDQAVLAGAHQTSMVSRRTSASTACGTCRPRVQEIIDYRLNRKKAG